MPTIDFVLVGAAKSGTTSLHRYLGGHPGLFLPKAKELAFFYGKSLEARQHELVSESYTGLRQGQKVGLTEANMLMFEDVPQRIVEHNANAKALIILRNPIERAYSSYLFGRVRGWETSQTFEEALERELNGELKSRKERIDFAHLEHGHYQQQIERFAAVLGRQNLMIMLMEDLTDNPRDTLIKVFGWLGVEPSVKGIDYHRRYNVTSTERFGLAKNARRMVPGSMRKYLRHRLSSENLRRLKRALNWLREKDQVPLEKPPMRQEIRQFLRSYYAKRNANLGALIGRDVSHWS